MRLLIVGTGSIGRRHAANAVDRAEVLLHDRDPDRARDVAAATGATACDTLEAALAARPLAAIVATPHGDHAATAARLLAAGCHCLVEKPLTDRLAAAHDLVERAAAADRRLYVACNMRFHAGPATLKTNLAAIGRPLFARAHFGNWLPAMRPGVDPRDLYCARRADGGGVVLDGIHELDYLTWLLGPVTAARGDTARLGTVTVDAEDYAAIALDHGGVRSQIHLDYLRAGKRRGCEIVGSEGVLAWESEGKRPEHCRVRLFRRDGEGWDTLVEESDLDPDTAYRAMLECFLAAAAGGPDTDLLDGATAAAELATALAIREGEAA